MPFTGAVIETAKKTPNLIALADAQGGLSYADIVTNGKALNAGIESILRAQDPVKIGLLTVPEEVGDIPVIMMSLSRVADAAALVAMLAGFRTISSVLDPLWPIEHRERSLRAAGARILVTDDAEFVEHLKEQSWPGTILTTEQLNDAVREAVAQGQLADLPEASVRDGEEPFTLIFTSGTTDLPKGFLRTRKSWRVNAEISKKYLYAQPQIRTIAPGPLAYSLTLYALVESLATGGTIWLQSRFDAVEAVNMIAQKHIERIVAVPAVIPAIVAASTRTDSAINSLKYAVVGGANLSARNRMKFEEAAPQAKILSYYGAAEIGFIGYSLDGDGTALKLFEGVEARVRDVAGGDLADGQLGTLFIRVASQGDRYISTAGAEEITGSDGWATVNDQATMINGKLILAGRAGDIAITGGHKVSLQQVDTALQAIPAAEHSISVAAPDKNLGTIIYAVIESSNPINKKELLAQLQKSLAPQFIPKRVYRADKLPRTVGGKIRRGAALAELLAEKYERVT